jgi:hypothetical protein
MRWGDDAVVRSGGYCRPNGSVKEDGRWWMKKVERGSRKKDEKRRVKGVVGGGSKKWCERKRIYSTLNHQQTKRQENEEGEKKGRKLIHNVHLSQIKFTKLWWWKGEW